MKMVKKPRNSLLAVAIASAIGSAALVSAPASAMNLAPDQGGQVLFFPYYTVKNGWDTYVHLTNTSTATVIAKVRFREAKNSREVRDFNLILSPRDQWTAAITIDGDNGAKLVTYDTTCTSPILPQLATGGRGIDFTAAGYDGTLANGFDNNASAIADNLNYDNGGTSLSRVQEGYLEVLVMGVSNGATGGTAAVTTAGTGFNVVEWNAKHVNGVPRSCETVDAQFANAAATNGYYTDTGNGSTSEPFSNFNLANSNVLKGFSTLINVASGQAVGVEPTVIANWATAVSGTFDPASNHLIYQPGDEKPDVRYAAIDPANGQFLVSVLPATLYTANWFIQNTGAFGTQNYARAEDAVSQLLMRASIANEFTSNAANNSKTNWVVTFPTKHFYTDFTNGAYGTGLGYDDDNLTTNAIGGGVGMSPGRNARAPFAQGFWGTSCDSVSFGQYGREEQTTTVVSQTQFSPRQPGAVGNQLCYEANVITFNDENLFNSSVAANINTAVGTAGWVSMSLTGTGASGTNGLPAIGFAIHTRNNAAEAGNNRNYAVAQEHTYVRGNLPLQ